MGDPASPEAKEGTMSPRRLLPPADQSVPLSCPTVKSCPTAPPLQRAGAYNSSDPASSPKPAAEAKAFRELGEKLTAHDFSWAVL